MRVSLRRLIHRAVEDSRRPDSSNWRPGCVSVLEERAITRPGATPNPSYDNSEPRAVVVLSTASVAKGVLGNQRWSCIQPIDLLTWIGASVAMKTETGLNARHWDWYVCDAT